MNPAQCPICFGPLEPRDVTPCHICGGRPESVAGFDPTATFTQFRLPSGHGVTLCRACELEEFMVPGGWGYRLVPRESLPVKGLRRVRAIDSPQLVREKFCQACDLRLAFAEVVAEHGHAVSGAAPAGPPADTA